MPGIPTGAAALLRDCATFRTGGVDVGKTAAARALGEAEGLHVEPIDLATATRDALFPASRVHPDAPGVRGAELIADPPFSGELWDRYTSLWESPGSLWTSSG
jgi:hypothetical protein